MRGIQYFVRKKTVFERGPPGEEEIKACNNWEKFNGPAEARLGIKRSIRKFPR